MDKEQKRDIMILLIVSSIMGVLLAGVYLFNLKKGKEYSKNLFDLNSELREQVENINLNEDGSCPPIEDNEIYKKTVEYDSENKCWVITVSERNSSVSMEYGQTITKSLKVNGEYAIYFKYSSQEQFMKQYKENDELAFSLMVDVSLIVLIISCILKLIVSRKENSCQKSS